MAAETTTPAGAAGRAWDALSRARVLLFACAEQPARAELLTALDEARRLVAELTGDAGPGAVDTLDALADEIRSWQRATFPQATPHSVTEHLRREAIELATAPTDPEEIADVFLLTIGAANAAGHDLVTIVRAKLEKNKARTWGQPDEHGVVEHMRETAEAHHGR